MIRRISRRDVLTGGATAGALFGLGDLGFLSRLRAVSAAEAQLDPGVVRLQPEIEPLVHFLEQTPRDELLEKVAAKIHRGLSYQELLAALLLAGVKNVEPRPNVGFQFHAVLVVNSAHLASVASPPEHRWLPIFWALDYYKSAAARDVAERDDWTMSAVDESAVSPAHKAHAAFIGAMDNWDEAAADAAVAGLARTAGANEIYELFFKYGMRDFRSIGHKAIYVANSWRTLQCIGWQHAEPVVRSLAYALLMHERGNPAERDDPADRPFRHNQTLAGKIRSDWRDGQLNKAAANELIVALRTATPEDASNLVVESLNRGVSPQSVWDGLHVAAAELLMRQPEIVPLHAVTTTNALRFAFQTCSDDETRRLLMLQNAAFLCLFRTAADGRGRLADLKIDDLSTRDAANDRNEVRVEAIFEELDRDRLTAARQTREFLTRTDANPQAAAQLIDAARVLVFLKGNDAHDYKFSSAVLEDYYSISRDWRDSYLAANVFKLRSAGDRDNSLVERTRAALKA